MDASKPLLEKFEVFISKNVFVEIHAAYQWKPKHSLTCKAFGHTPSKKKRVENADKAIANATNPCNNKKLEHWDMPNVIPRTGNSELGRGEIINVVQVATSSSQEQENPKDAASIDSVVATINKY